MADSDDMIDDIVLRVKLDPEKIYEEIADDNFISALLFAATELERSLSFRLRRHLEIDSNKFEKLFESKSVGWYYNKCCEFSLISKEKRRIFDDLIEKRNRVAHDLDYIKKLRENNDEKDEIIDLLLKFCDLNEVPENVHK